MVKFRKQILIDFQFTQEQIEGYNALVECTGPRYGKVGKCENELGVIGHDEISHQAMEIHPCNAGVPNSYYIYILQLDNKAGIELDYGRFEFEPRIVDDRIVAFDAIRKKAY